jgi:hypothetical protein
MGGMGGIGGVGGMGGYADESIRVDYVDPAAEREKKKLLDAYKRAERRNAAAIARGHTPSQGEGDGKGKGIEIEHENGNEDSIDSERTEGVGAGRRGKKSRLR